MADYTYKPSINIDSLVSGLKNLKAEAVSAEKVMAMIGNRGNLNKLLETFLRMDDLVNNLTRDSDKLRVSFGQKLRGGYLDSLDSQFDKLSTTIKQTRELTEQTLNIDLRKSGAKEQIRGVAGQINAMASGLGVKDKIDFDVFDAKSLKDQRDELIHFINQIGSQITIAVGQIDTSQLAIIGNQIGGAISDGFDNATKKTKDSGEKLSDAVQAEIDKVQEEINEFTSLQDKLKSVSDNIKRFYDGDSLKVKIKDKESAEQIYERYKFLTERSNQEDLSDYDYSKVMVERAEALLQLEKLRDSGVNLSTPIRQTLDDDLEDVFSIVENQENELKSFLKAAIKERNKTIDNLKNSNDLSGSKFKDDVDASDFKNFSSEVDNASNKVEEFKKLCGDISSAWMRDDMSNFDIGINTEKLETAKKELDALGEQGKITADELEQINDVFNRAKTELGEIKTRNEDRGYDKEGYGDGYGSGYGSGSYDYSFEDEYRDAEERAISAEVALRLKQEENAELRKQISDKKKKLYETPSGQMSLFENMAEDAQKANDSASKLENTVKNIENLDGQISLFDKPDLYENADGELSLWENADAGAKKTEESINGVRDAIKEVKNLDGQINLFEQMDAERAANEVQQLEAHLQSLGNEFQQSQQFSNIWTNLSNEVKSGAKTAEQAIKELDSAFSKFDAEKNMSRIEQTTKAQKDKVNKLFKSLDFDLTTPDLTYGQKSIADKYQDVITQINALKKNSAKATSAQVNDINTVIAALEKEINAYKVQNNLTDQATKKATKGMANYGARDVEKAQGRYDLLSQSANSYVQNGSVPIGNALNKYTTALNNLIAAQKKFSAIQDSTSAEASQARTEFDKLKIQYNDCARALSNLIKQSESFQGKNKKIEKLNGAYDLESEAGRGDALKDYIQNVYGADAAIGQFNDSVTELNFTLKNADGTVSQMSASFDESMSMIGSSTQKVEKSTNMFSSMFGEIKKKGKELLQYTAARIGIDEVIQQVRNGIQYVIEIDTALTELKKVTNETDATYNQFLQTASKTAGVIGSTVSELTTMSAEWARLNI